MQTFITGIRYRHGSYRLSCNTASRLYLYPVVPMAMGYLDRFSSLVRRYSKLGAYTTSSKGNRDNSNYLRCCSTLEYSFVPKAIGSGRLLYIRLLSWGFLVSNCVSADHQEKLYRAVTQYCSTLAMYNYVGNWQEPIYHNY